MATDVISNGYVHLNESEGIMGEPSSHVQVPDLAREIATRLAAAADGLALAGDAQEFVAAVAAHRRAWQRVQGAQTSLRYKIPPQVIDFCLGPADRIRPGLDDLLIESLIKINRSVSAAIAQTSRN